jgi:hypothetical protein
MADEAKDESSRYAVLRFVHPHDHMFGSPNDEALDGHPLYKIGLSHYAFYQVFDSPWIKQLERMWLLSISGWPGLQDFATPLLFRLPIGRMLVPVPRGAGSVPGSVIEVRCSSWRDV